MRPLAITLAGFRSFRGEQTIDFRNLGLFAVVGDTGAGKSSILEAMVYALYNATTWSERDVKTLIALDAQTMRVDFDFTVDGTAYRITRSASKVGRPPIHSLRSDADPDFHVDGEAAVAREIKRLIRLDWKTFTKTVVLPQGRFADLLNATEGDRTRALTELLDLDEIDRIRDVVEVPREAAQSRRAILRAQRDELGASPEAAAAAAREAFAVVSDRCTTLLGVQIAVESARERRRGAADTARQVESALVAHDRIARSLSAIVALRELDATLRRTLEELREEWEAARAATAVMCAQRDRMTTAGLAAAALGSARTILERLGPERRRLAEELRGLTSARDGQARMAAELTVGDARLSELRASHAAAAELVREGDAARLAAKDAVDVRRAAWQAHRTVADRLAMREEALRLANDRRKIASAATSAMRHGYDEALGERAAATLHLAAVERDDRIAALVSGLAPKAPCPVCARALPSDFEAPIVHAVDEARRLASSAETALAAALERLQTAQHNEAAAEASLSGAAAELDRAKDDVAATLSRLVELGVSQTAETVDEAVAPAIVAEKELAARLSEQRARSDEAQDALLRATTEAQLLRGKLAADAAQLERRARSLADAQRRLEIDRCSLPAPLRPSERLEDDEIAAAAISLEAAECEGKRIDEGLTSASVAERDAQRRFDGAIARRRADVEAVIDVRLGDVSRDASSLALDASAYEALPAYDPLSADPDAVFRAAAGANARAAAEMAHLATQREALAAEQARADADVVAQLATTGLANVAALSAAVLETTATRATLEARVVSADAAVRKAAALDAELAIVEPLSAALSDLRTYLQPSAFKAYVMARRENRLLGIATEILRDMTGGRLAFAAGFKILDGATGQTRGPLTLSGGEKFLASLALALALVEVASQAGSRLEALFLDEGFGSLDTRTLDAALTELAKRASGGKLIGVITHIAAIAGEIDDVLRVQRPATGSVVERLDARERERFFDDIAGSRLLVALGE